MLKHSKIYTVQSIGDLGPIVTVEDEHSTTPKFCLSEKVKFAVLPLLSKGYALFCLSESEKIAQFICADVA